MVSSVPDGLCSEMIIVFISKAQIANIGRAGQQFLEPLADQLIAALKPVVGRVVQRGFLDVDIESHILFRDVRCAELRSFGFIVHDADILVNHQFVRQRVLHEMLFNERFDIRVRRYAHLRLQFRIREQHVADHIVPVIVPCL